MHKNDNFNNNDKEIENNVKPVSDIPCVDITLK